MQNNTMGEKMKKLHFASLLFVAMSITSLQAEWIDPNSASCTSNGGKFDPSGICEANWHQAKNICSAMDARLPAIGELEKVITDCGGVVNDFENNKNNSSYQSCYQNKGFRDTASRYYWSATTYVRGTSYAWYVYLYHGFSYRSDKSRSYYVRCVR